MLGWTITAAFLLALLYTVPLREVWEGLHRLQPLSAMGAMVLVVSTLWLRGARWSLLFLPHHRVQPTEAAELAIVGLALNAVLPGRVGEVARVGLASRRFGMKIGFTTATLVAERLLDGITLIIFAGIALLVLPSISEPRSVTILGADVSGEALATTLVSLGGICLLLAVATMVVSHSKPEGLPLRWAGRLPEPIARRLVPRLRAFLLALRQGLTGLSRLGTLLQLTLYSAAIWLGITMANLVVALGMAGFHLSFGEALVVTAVSVAASSLPSAPGAWGVFESGGVLALQALQPELDLGLAVAFMFAAHICQYLPTVSTGFLFWLTARRRE